MKSADLAKVSILVLFFVYLSGFFAGITAQIFNNPESVVFDYQNMRWLISNKANGNILQQDLDGNLNYFVQSGLDNPKGIIIVDGVAYVNENTSVKGFDLTTGTEVFSLDDIVTAFEWALKQNINKVFVKP